jgi:hypothetical protein
MDESCSPKEDLMNTRTVLTAAAVVALVFALGLLLMPTFMGTLYGLGASPVQELIARFFGATLLGVGLINWFAKDMDYATLRPVILGNLIGNAVGLIVALMGTLGGVMNSVGWLSIAIYLLFTLAFGYFQFLGQPVSVRQRA